MDGLENLPLGERERMQARAAELGYAFVDLDRVRHSMAKPSDLDKDIALRYGLIPIKRDRDTLWLAMSEPDNLEAVDAAALSSRSRIVPVMALPDAIERALA